MVRILLVDYSKGVVGYLVMQLRDAESTVIYVDFVPRFWLRLHEPGKFVQEICKKPRYIPCGFSHRKLGRGSYGNNQLDQTVFVVHFHALRWRCLLRFMGGD